MLFNVSLKDRVGEMLKVYYKGEVYFGYLEKVGVAKRGGHEWFLINLDGQYHSFVSRNASVQFVE